MTDFIWIALLGGTLALDRAAGWNFLLSQPLVGACLAGALFNPGPEWELWALRVPLGVGALLQLLMTDEALPSAQRLHDTATAGVIGTTAATHVMVRTHETFPLGVSGMLWVLVGVAVGLAAAWGGGFLLRAHGIASRLDVRRGDRLLQAGEERAFERLYRGALLRIFFLGALWCWLATWAASAIVARLLPESASLVTPNRVAVVFAVLLGAAVATAYRTHVAGRRHALRWAALGAVVAALLLEAFRGGGA